MIKKIKTFRKGVIIMGSWMNALIRVQNTIDFIEENLAKTASIDGVVAKSGYSTPHFYRLFWNLTGRTLKQYIRLRRLSQAFEKIAIEGRCDLIDIAFDCGFSSQEAFTRAFKREFGFTPGFVRKKKITITPFEKLNLVELYKQYDFDTSGSFLSKSVVSLENGLVFYSVANDRPSAISSIISSIITTNESTPSSIYAQRVGRSGSYEAFAYTNQTDNLPARMFYGGLYLSIKQDGTNLDEPTLINQLSDWFKSSKMEVRNSKILTETDPRTRKIQYHLVPIRNTTRRFIMTKPEEFADVYEIELPPFRVASYRATSSTPEDDAFRVLFAWAKKKGLIEKSETRIFGFNNPNPTEGNPVYGYEFWVMVDDDVVGDDVIQIKEFEGGLYGAVDIVFKNMGANWGKLIKWRKFMGYEYGRHQWLEEAKSFRDPPEDFGETKMTLYTPIKK